MSRSRRAGTAVTAEVMPGAVARWVESVLGPIDRVRGASRRRPGSRVWEVVATRSGRRYFVKVSPKPEFYTRETYAYRHAVPALGAGNGPCLVDSSAEHLALVLTAVEGVPVAQLVADRRLSPVRRRAVHRQAGALLRRFHEAGAPDAGAGREAEQVVGEATVAGVDRHIFEAGPHLTTAEADVLRRAAGELRNVGPLPVGLRHGDFWERNFLWDGRRCALVDFERGTAGPVAGDFVRLAGDVWDAQPELRSALFEGYGRQLTDAEERALTCLAAADAASALAYGPRHDDAQVTARGRRTVERLMRGVFA
ncbi:phosphotransferase enzyme family protein [Actinomycetota bacterium Odt1-20B]